MARIYQPQTNHSGLSTSQELNNEDVRIELATDELSLLPLPQLKSIAQQRAGAGEHHLAGWKRWRSKGRLIRELAICEYKPVHLPFDLPLPLDKQKQFPNDSIDVLTQLCRQKLDDWLFSDRIAISAKGRTDFRAIAIEIQRRLKLLGLRHKGLEPFISESSRGIVGATVKTQIHHQFTIPTLNPNHSYPKGRELFKQEVTILLNQITRETSNSPSHCTAESNEYLKPADIRERLKLGKGQLDRSTLKRYKDKKLIRFKTVGEGSRVRFFYHLDDVRSQFQNVYTSSTIVA